jgi:CSLREA domain-containing protein
MLSKLSFIAIFLLALITVSSAEAATFTVTKTADTADGVCDSDCSFREAIIAANQNGSGADTINFSIPGSGVKTILLTSEIPHVRTSVTINGQTQSGYFGKPMIELRGNSSVPEALHLISPSPAVPISVTIYGLAINSFGLRGILSTCLVKCDLTLKGNFIGTDPNGAIDMGNGLHGVEVLPSPDSIVTIGGSGTFEGNVISGNGGVNNSNDESGIIVKPAPMEESNQGSIVVNIIGNKIGTDFTGSVDLGNTDDGIHVSERSELGSYSTFAIELNVGGSTAAARNVISGNDGTGIYANVTKASIKGNYIGTNAAGTGAMGNKDADEPDDGIYILPHPNGSYQIGGTGPNEGNVISDNGSSGIEIDTYISFEPDPTVPVTIIGNKIGTNAAGTADLGNAWEGIRIGKIPNLGLDVSIGGLGNAPNLISGNGTHGITVNGEKVKIYANKIGTNIDGTTAIANGADGVHLVPYTDGIDVTVGGSVVLDGTTYDLGNLISGNGGGGIHFEANGAAYSPLTFRRNRIGTNAAATSALPNGGNGIFLKEGGAMIGSNSIAADGNVISGNADNGIELMGDPGDHPSEVYGNKIGTNGVGGSPIPNGEDGIEINGSKYNKIGLAGNAAAVNVISGNAGAGISIVTAFATNNQVENNLIGTGPALNDLGNGGAGVVFGGLPTKNFVGSSNGSGNIIAYNARGIWAQGGSDNEFRRNSIYANDDLGIDLDAIGVTPNDPGDVDSGGNRKQNFPVLGRVTPTAITGSLNSTAEKNFTIDFYRADSCDANGHGEGRYFLGSTAVVTDALGNASFNYPASLTLGQSITATATVTDIVGADDTSEFSQCKVVVPAPTVAFSVAAYGVNEGGGSRTIIVNRSGALDGPMSVNYATSNGTATAGEDYTVASGTLNFADGETLKTFDVAITNDSWDEPDETINLTLSNPTGGGSLGANATAVLTIADNDPTPAINITSVTANEGNSGTTAFTFTISLSSPSAQTVGVHYETEEGPGTTPWTDYTPAAGNLSFGPNELSKTVTVNVVGDTAPEPDETFFLFLSVPINATIGTSGGLGTIVNDDSAIPHRSTFDYDGDGKSDISIFRPSNGQWWLNRSTAGVLATTFGTGTDKIVPADFTGDGKTDVAIWRPSNGSWFVLRSEDSSFYAFPFGTNGDMPMPADYDADGKADAAVFRPSNATWYINKSSGGTLIMNFGAVGDIPVADDYDGDGKADVAVYRPSSGQWWLNRSTAGVYVATFGTATDKPIHADFTGDGKADIAFWRPSTGDWFVLRSEDASFYAFPFGTTGDIASAGDFDGDGKADPAIFRPSNATWFINRTSEGILIQAFGSNGDLPTPAAFVP